MFSFIIKDRYRRMNACFPIIGIVFLLCIFITRLYLQNYYPLNEDEPSSINIFIKIANGDIPLNDLNFWRSPFTNIISAIPLLIFDVSTTSARLAGLIFSTLLLYTVYAMGVQANNKIAGILSSVFLGFSVLENFYVSNARFYPEFQFFFISSLYLIGTYFILGKRQHGGLLLLSLIASIFSHELSLQLFPIIIIAIIIGRGFALLKDKTFIFSSLAVLLIAFIHLYLRSGHNPLVPRDYSETMIEFSIGGLFRSGGIRTFYDYFMGAFPLGWTLLIAGIFLSWYFKNLLWIYYIASFIFIFITTTLLAPYGNLTYMSHLYPLGVLCAFMTLSSLFDSNLWHQLRSSKPLAVKGFMGSIGFVSLMFFSGLDGVPDRFPLGFWLKSEDQKAPHEIIKKYISPGDLVFTVDPGLTSFYLGHKNTYFLRQRYDQKTNTYTTFKDNNDNFLVDSKLKLESLLQSRKGAVWIYANRKYDSTVDPEIRNIINGYSPRFPYINSKDLIYVMYFK